MQQNYFILALVVTATMTVLGGFAINSGHSVEVNLRPGWVQVKIDGRVNYLLDMPTSSKEKPPESNPPSLEP